MAVDKNLVGGSTVYMLLSLLAQKEYYGYEIIKEIERRSDATFQFKEGTLYPVLHRMEQQGYLKSRVEKAENGRPRKYYKITRKGSAQLAVEQAQWDTFVQSVRGVVGRRVYGMA